MTATLSAYLNPGNYTKSEANGQTHCLTALELYSRDGAMHPDANAEDAFWNLILGIPPKTNPEIYLAAKNLGLMPKILAAASRIEITKDTDVAGNLAFALAALAIDNAYSKHPRSLDSDVNKKYVDNSARAIYGLLKTIADYPKDYSWTADYTTTVDDAVKKAAGNEKAKKAKAEKESAQLAKDKAAGTKKADDKPGKKQVEKPTATADQSEKDKAAAKEYDNLIATDQAAADKADQDSKDASKQVKACNDIKAWNTADGSLAPNLMELYRLCYGLNPAKLFALVHAHFE